VQIKPRAFPTLALSTDHNSREISNEYSCYPSTSKQLQAMQKSLLSNTSAALGDKNNDLFFTIWKYFIVLALLLAKRHIIRIFLEGVGAGGRNDPSIVCTYE
jgi:hypothetical protein